MESVKTNTPLNSGTVVGVSCCKLAFAHRIRLLHTSTK